MAGEMLLTPEEIDELKQTFIGMIQHWLAHSCPTNFK